MGVVIGVDGGSSKTELLAVTHEGEPVAHIRGPGSNSHTLGVEGAVDVLAELVERAAPAGAVDRAAFFLCGADLPSDIAELEHALARRGWAREVTVDNDTFALLRTGARDGNAVAVVCGSGINCVGRAADGRVARYPGLGWETGDWGGSEALGREALFLAARAEDGRGQRTVLVDAIRSHFGAGTVAELGEVAHYRRRPVRLGELAPAVLAAAAEGDAVALGLVRRLADEIVLLVERALRDLELAEAATVLGGGMLREGFLVEAVAARVPNPVVVREPPVLGAALAALDASPETEARLRAAFP
jgi:N-acetylglucosamine kinase-like BadF-type ATPase